MISLGHIGIYYIYQGGGGVTQDVGSGTMGVKNVGSGTIGVYKCGKWDFHFDVGLAIVVEILLCFPYKMALLIIIK